MRFAGNTSNVGSWIQAGKAGAKGAADAFKVARASSPDYGGIAEANMKSRSAERVAATEAEAYVARAGIQAKKDVKLTNIKVDAEAKILDKKIDAKRKAGMVGMFGAVALGGVNAVESNRAAKKEAERDAKRDASEAAQLEWLKNRTENAPEAPDEVPWVAGTPPESTAYVQKPYESGDSSSDSSTDTDKPSDSVSTPQQPSGQMSAEFQKIYDLAVKDGRSKFPEVVAAQAMHETGHLSSTIDSVYNSSGGTNPFGQTGDRGFGTMTREGDSSGWSKFPDLQAAVSDHITLWHDTGNHSENYNAFGTIEEGLSKVIPAYSPNSDPANQSLGYTESGYSAAVKKILRDNGFKVK